MVIVVAAFISRTPGDPEKLRQIYENTYRASAGQHGRGEDWGIPLVVLQHLCGFTDDAMYLIDVFQDDETLDLLTWHADQLPAHLRPEISGTTSMWKQMGVPNLRDRWEEDVTRIKVAKMLPPLTAILPEEGGARRRRY